VSLDSLLKLPQRVVDKIRINVTSGCWEWTGSHNYKGYGHCYLAGRLLGAHRVVWTLLRSEVPRGLVLDHLCRVRHCVNPAHLEAVTVRVNTLRGNGPTAQRHRARLQREGQLT
jgi:hypothetical protein